MLSATHRLRRDAEIRQVIRSGRGQHGKYVSIKWLATDKPASRFCVVVGNKVSKKANRRNTIRRRLREIVRLHLTEITAGIDLVIFAQAGSGVLEADYHELERDLLALLRRQKLFVEKI